MKIYADSSVSNLHVISAASSKLRDFTMIHKYHPAFNLCFDIGHKVLGFDFLTLIDEARRH